MTLETIADVSAIGAALATVLIALWVFLWTRRTEQNNQRRHSNNEMQAYNLAVIQDDRLLKLEADNHPHGKISLDDTLKMYRYFLWLNVADNNRRATEIGLLDRRQRDARLENLARVAFPDREFLEKHVFPRGYEAEFIETFRIRWRAIEATHHPLGSQQA